MLAPSLRLYVFRRCHPSTVLLAALFPLQLVPLAEVLPYPLCRPPDLQQVEGGHHGRVGPVVPHRHIARGRKTHQPAHIPGGDLQAIDVRRQGGALHIRPHHPQAAVELHDAHGDAVDDLLPLLKVHQGVREEAGAAEVVQDDLPDAPDACDRGVGAHPHTLDQQVEDQQAARGLVVTGQNKREERADDELGIVEDRIDVIRTQTLDGAVE
mmetsp:Transcript_51161/g.128463  ORF Transcript_51161/g.128463 Transcript_51161/m.128463 type:complete len:211 (+) Transcript_51161:1257-1889(+)